jgi:hypothetical protein
MGFPSRRARTRASNRAPGEILIEEWKGNDIEKALVSIHPERFKDVTQVALSTLFVIGNEVYGSRRNLGSNTLGVLMDKNTGNLVYASDDKGQHAKSTITNVVRRLGQIPEGFADMPEPKQRTQTNRQLKYACQTCGTIIRSAGQALESLCLHGGKPQHGLAATPFVQSTKTTQSQTQPQAVAPVAVQELTPEQNILNATRLVKSGAAKVVHGRNFGVEAATA